jgi:O-glycosyl hydrolase
MMCLKEKLPDGRRANRVRALKITLVVLMVAAFSAASPAQMMTNLVDQFDPSGAGGNSYSGGQIGNVWGNWFGGAFQSLVWDSTSDANTNANSGSMKITANFTGNDGKSQFEVYDLNGIYPPVNGLQYTNFQCDVRFAKGSATVNNTFGHLEFGTAAGTGQDYFGSVDVPSSNTNWVHVSINLNATTDANLQTINDVLIHIYGPYYSPGLSGASTLWVDNIQFTGPAPVSTNCVVDWNDAHQRIDGFGASSAWESSLSTAQADMFFSTNLGIGLSLLRNRIAPGGTTWETSIMQMARDRGARIWSTPWSPQASFKSNNSTTNGGNFLSASNRAYASQLAGYVATMKNTYGVNLYAISIQNEPEVTAGYESCVWTPQQIHDFATNLYSALVASNVASTKIMLAEDENWQTNYYFPAMNDPAVATNAGIIACHNYDGSPPGGIPAALPKFTNPNAALWETEVSTFNSFDGGMNDALYWASRIHLFMTAAQANAFHYWWLISANADNEGLTDNSGNPAKRMYVLGQYSRFVRPGYYRIGVSNNATTLISAYKDPNSGGFAIVAANTASVTVTQTFNLKNFTTRAVTPWITSSNLSLAGQSTIAVTNSSFAYTLPALSVVTFVGQNNSAPTDISLSNSNVAENLPSGAVVGNFSTTDPDNGNTFTYTLVSGAGSSDNGSFTITNNTLYTAASFNYEVQNSYSIRVRSTDQGGLYFEKTFTILVTNVNESPANISLSNTNIAENPPSGTAVGNFSTTDPDNGNTFTYTLVSGAGSSDNGSFTITNNTLYTAASFNYEVQNSYSIRVRSTDQGGLYFEKTFTILVTNVNEPPNSPVNVLPANGDTNQSPTLMLQSSVFSDPDLNDTQAASQWLIRRSTDNAIVFDSGNDVTDKTNLTVASGVLDYSTFYNWQVRHQDNHGAWSGYSVTTTFATLAPTLGLVGQNGNAVIFWPTNTSGFALEGTTNLSATNWSPTLPLPTIIGTQNVVTNQPGNDVQFYRLRKP